MKVINRMKRDGQRKVIAKKLQLNLMEAGHRPHHQSKLNKPKQNNKHKVDPPLKSKKATRQQHLRKDFKHLAINMAKQTNMLSNQSNRTHNSMQPLKS